MKHPMTFSSILLLFLKMTATAPAQPVIKIDTLNLEKLQGIVQQIEDENKKSNEKLKFLEATITKQNFTKVLKTANIEKYRSDVNLLKARYMAGEEILNHIIQETNQFNLSYSQLVLQNEFSSLLNPLNYPDFTGTLKTTLNSLKDRKPVPDISQDLSNLSQSIPYLKNPFVMSGFSIASYFIAKYNDKKKTDNENFQKMTCVLNFVSTTHDEYGLNVQRVLFMRDKIVKLNTNLKDFFSQYLKAIGYEGGYKAYMESRMNVGSDFLKKARDDFFISLLADTANTGIVGWSTDKDDNVSFYIEQVKFYISEYENILRDIESSITAYDLFYQGLKVSSDNSCTGVKNAAATPLSAINDNISRVKTAFRIVNEENRIPANLKRTLFGL